MVVLIASFSPAKATEPHIGGQCQRSTKMRKAEAIRDNNLLNGYLAVMTRLAERVEKERDQLIDTLARTEIVCDNTREELVIYLKAYSEVAGRLAAHLGLEGSGAVEFANEVLVRISAEVKEHSG